MSKLKKILKTIGLIVFFIAGIIFLLLLCYLTDQPEKLIRTTSDKQKAAAY